MENLTQPLHFQGMGDMVCHRHMALALLVHSYHQLIQNLVHIVLVVMGHMRLFRRRLLSNNLEDISYSLENIDRLHSYPSL
jgi:hypothetical protein